MGGRERGLIGAWREQDQRFLQLLQLPTSGGLAATSQHLETCRQCIKYPMRISQPQNIARGWLTL